MNVAYEFSKVKEAFERVKADMSFLSKKVTENYENFMREHYKLSKEVAKLSEEIRTHIEHVHKHHEHADETKKLTPKQIADINYISKELREEIKKTHDEHDSMMKMFEDLKSVGEKNNKKLQERMQSSELEIYLLKEKLVEKDQELKQVKEISSHLFNLVKELAEMEEELAGKTKRGKK